MKVLFTGASGFIGQKVLESFKDEFNFRCVLRQNKPNLNVFEPYYIHNIDGNTCWDSAFTDVSSILHLAGCAHGTSDDPEYIYNVNTLGTLKLAEDAASAGVKRFVFLSSINVIELERQLDPIISPQTRSKYEAEIGLKKIAGKTGMEVVIIRPPLVYGKGAPGNFGMLLKIADKNYPLPLASINNKRSYVALDNIADLIIKCIDSPKAANQTFLVSDDESISTPNLLEKLIVAAGKKPCLLPVPVSFLKFLALITGKKVALDKLISSLAFDIEHTKNTLNWKPPITLDEGIRRCFK